MNVQKRTSSQQRERPDKKEAAMAEADRHHLLGGEALLGALLLLLVLFIHHWLERRRWFAIPHSIWALGVGFIVGGILYGLSKKKGDEAINFALFDSDLVFLMILPPMIFEAGFSLNKRAFFANLGSITLHAVLGSVFTTLVVGYGLFGMAKSGAVPLDSNNVLECLTVGALLAATDTVTLKNILRWRPGSTKRRKVLYHITFGEAVLNNAVAIVLYQILLRQSESGGDMSSFRIVIDLVLKFIKICVFSVLCGLAIGLLAAWALKCLPKAGADSVGSPEWELLIIFFSAYASYISIDLLGFSGIMGLFMTGIVLGHYGYWNIGTTSMAVSQYTFKSASFLAEITLYIYMGANALILLANPPGDSYPWSAKMIFATLALCLLARAVTVPAISFLLNRYRQNKIDKGMQLMMWWGGLRGAISFALAANMRSPAAEFIQTTTIAIVVLTTLCWGTSADAMMRRLKIETSGQQHATELLRESEGASQTEEQDELMGRDFKPVCPFTNLSRIDGLMVVAETPVLQNVVAETPVLQNELDALRRQRKGLSATRTQMVGFEHDYMQPIFGGPQLWLGNIIDLRSGQMFTGRMESKQTPPRWADCLRALFGCSKLACQNTCAPCLPCLGKRLRAVQPAEQPAGPSHGGTQSEEPPAPEL
eukprot:g64387.t1